MYGFSGNPTGQYERGGNNGSILDDDESFIIQQPAGTNFIFTGGMRVAAVGGILDANNDGQISNGDMAFISQNYLLSGATTLTFDYPGDFTPLTGCGTITIRLLNANSAHLGRTFMYGASGIIAGQYERGGDSVTISSDDMSNVIQIPGGTDYLFPGIYAIRYVGGLIDANGDGQILNGDYRAGYTNYVVNGNSTVMLRY